MLKESEIENFIKEVNELLNEIKEEQKNIVTNIDKYHKVNMKNFAKLREFNEICDMTNQVFEKRLLNIEQVLKENTKKWQIILLKMKNKVTIKSKI